jgi:hypothetical protein
VLILIHIIKDMQQSNGSGGDGSSSCHKRESIADCLFIFFAHDKFTADKQKYPELKNNNIMSVDPHPHHQGHATIKWQWRRWFQQLPQTRKYCRLPIHIFCP